MIPKYKDVERSINWVMFELDYELGPDWIEEINLERLDMRDAVNGCIGAQLGWPECTLWKGEDHENALALCWNGSSYYNSWIAENIWISKIRKRLRVARVLELVNKFKNWNNG